MERAARIAALRSKALVDFSSLSYVLSDAIHYIPAKKLLGYGVSGPMGSISGQLRTVTKSIRSDPAVLYARHGVARGAFAAATGWVAQGAGPAARIGCTQRIPETRKQGSDGGEQ